MVDIAGRSLIGHKSRSMLISCVYQQLSVQLIQRLSRSRTPTSLVVNLKVSGNFDLFDSLIFNNWMLWFFDFDLIVWLIPKICAFCLCCITSLWKLRKKYSKNQKNHKILILLIAWSILKRYALCLFCLTSLCKLTKKKSRCKIS